MKIFSATELKKVSEDKFLKQAKLNEAVTKQTKKLNELIASYEAKKEEFAKDLEISINKGTEEKKQLIDEVNSLRKARKEELKPIKSLETFLNAKQTELTAKEQAINAIASKLTTQSADILIKGQELTARERRVQDVDKSQSDRQIELDSHYNAIREKEMQIAVDEAEFETEKSKERAKLDKEKEELRANQVTLNILAEQLRIRDEKMTEDRRAIKDGYESLARAREEILGRKN